MAVPHPQSLCDTVQAAQRGDADAFSLLVVWFQEPLSRRIYRLTEDIDIAEDITQDAFLIAFAKIEQLLNGEFFWAWLHRIAVNRLKAEWQRQQNEKQLSLDERQNGANDSSLIVDQEFEATAIIRAELDSAFDHLSLRLRGAFELHYVNGYSAAEIAQKLNISLACAERRISRARHTVQELLTDTRAKNPR